MKKTVDYQKLRGFNYTQPDAANDRVFWAEYHHDIVDRDMGYAERLHLNSARIFLSYDFYKENPDRFLANVKDFVQTAWKHGISTNPIIFMGFRFREDELPWSGFMLEAGLKPIYKTLEDPSCWYIGEKYFDDLYEAIGHEEGLLFWDIANEPGYTDNFVTWYDEEPSYVQDYQERPNMELLRYRQEKTWEIVRHFCRYVKSKDQEHDIGIGNIFIFETEPSRTTELVDVIVFHDYFPTRKRMRDALEYAKKMGEKYGKPVLDNEMCCLARANPYDMSIEMHDEYQIGWYLFELMIGKDMWSRVHGVVYPDGTVRDPSIVAAIGGFFRNRSETAIRSDVNQEDYVKRVSILAERTLHAARQNKGSDHSQDVENLLEVCEYAANLLEAGELVPMAYPPTAKIAAYRRQQNVDAMEIEDYLTELMGTLKKACHIIE
uniref:hypothetical protein n=1 Tax=Eisenbergiella tayi TaxID=1432052 RepID=UPI003FEE98C8